MSGIIRAYRIFIAEVERRFWEKVQKGAEDECWPWVGSRNNTGYGVIHVMRVRYSAHRLAYELTHGEIGPGLDIRHRCDNPPCVNPRHLETGTRLQNMRDKCERGRQPRGSAHGASVLNEAQVSEIKIMLAAGKTTVDIAPIYNVSEGTIQAIRRGQTWGHVAWPQGAGFPRIGGERGEFTKKREVAA